MNGALLALLFFLGVAFLALGLIVVTLPLLSDISISFPWLVLGGACVVVGAFALWLVHNEVNLQASTPSASDRSFFTALGIFNLLVVALGACEGEWHSAKR